MKGAVDCCLQFHMTIKTAAETSIISLMGFKSHCLVIFIVIGKIFSGILIVILFYLLLFFIFGKIMTFLFPSPYWNIEKTLEVPQFPVHLMWSIFF